MELLFRPDDQVEEVQARLQLRGDVLARDEAALALAMTRHTPKVWAVVDVERGLQARLPRDAERLQNGSLGARVAEMRSRDAPRRGQIE